MASKQFQQSMVKQDHEILFEVVKMSGNWVFPEASSIVEATKGKNMYLRLTDDGRSDIFRLDSVKDGENSGEKVYNFVGNGGMDLVAFTAVTDGAGNVSGTWEYSPGEGPAGEAVAKIGKPLKLIGSATVSELNGTITGLEPGWTYTLTDAGTLTDGSIKVDAGDEVAWTEDDEWFKIGGEGGVKVFTVQFASGGYSLPSIDDINNAALQYKAVYLLLVNPGGGITYYQLAYRGSSSGTINVRFVDSRTGETLYGTKPNGGSDTWSTKSSDAMCNFAPDYASLTFPIAEGTQCMYAGRYYYCSVSGGIAVQEPWTSVHWTQTSVAEQIGNVETLLAAL